MLSIIEHYITVLKYAFKKKATLKYPEEKNDRSCHFRGAHAWNKDSCIKCKTCEKACIGKCISVDNRFEIDYQKCCFCGRCVHACPTHALSMTDKDVAPVAIKDDLKKNFEEE